MSHVEQVIDPQPKDLGDNFVVRRSLPHKDKKMVGPFIFWDHMGPVTLEKGKAMTVRAHPHIGLATITWLFSGEIMHRDSLNNEQPIRPGEVNWMTTGRGIVHSERANASQSPMTLEGIQLWLALPVAHEGVEPSFFHCKDQDLPKRVENGSVLTLIAGKALGMTSPVPVYSDLFYLQATSGKDAHFSMPLGPNQEGAVYVAKGSVDIEGTTFGQFSLVCFNKGAQVTYTARDECQIMLFGGTVFPEPRHLWWNFVASDMNQIEAAKTAWKEGRFPPVIHEHETIPLPE
jgi:hypothetical protein